VDASHRGRQGAPGCSGRASGFRAVLLYGGERRRSLQAGMAYREPTVMNPTPAPGEASAVNSLEGSPGAHLDVGPGVRTPMGSVGEGFRAGPQAALTHMHSRARHQERNAPDVPIVRSSGSKKRPRTWACPGQCFGLESLAMLLCRFPGNRLTERPLPADLRMARHGAQTAGSGRYDSR
jgi:hypothetical protein